jgi:hypothetical protein
MPRLSMTALLSVTLLLSDGPTVIPPMIAAVAVRRVACVGIGQLTRHPANPATTSPAEARMRGFRPAGSMNGKVKHGKRSPSDPQSLERPLRQRTDQHFGWIAS